MKLESYALTDRGRVREKNEDACLADGEHGLFIVADGVGGGPAGSAASQIVVKALPLLLDQQRAPGKTTRGGAEIIRRAILDLNERVYRESQSVTGLGGMGSTVALLQVRRHYAYVVNMGDSRVYLLRRKLRCLTEDHSIVSLLLRDGDITEKEAQDHPAKGSLTRFIGMELAVVPDVQRLALKTGDRLLLCTDGLWGMMPDNVIADILGMDAVPEDICRRLVDEANRRGGTDNVTAVVVAVQR